jgi:hypothetical protein
VQPVVQQLVVASTRCAASHCSNQDRAAMTVQRLVDAAVRRQPAVRQLVVQR